MGTTGADDPANLGALARAVCVLELDQHTLVGVIQRYGLDPALHRVAKFSEAVGEDLLGPPLRVEPGAGLTVEYVPDIEVTALPACADRTASGGISVLEAIR